MAASALHPGLLARRIVVLRKKAARKSDFERLLDMGTIERLERRHKLLVDQLRKLDAEGPGPWQDAKAEVAKLVDDIWASIEDSMMRLDRSVGHGKSV
jgi:hypothetical protein